MRILLDECIPKRLKFRLQEFEVFTVPEMGISGYKNGKLMTFCTEHNFDFLLTIDKNLMYQQNLDKYPVTIIVLNSYSSKAEDLSGFLPDFITNISKFERHKAYIIEKP